MVVDCSFGSCIKYEGRTQSIRLIRTSWLLSIHCTICIPRVTSVWHAHRAFSTSAFHSVNDFKCKRNTENDTLAHSKKKYAFRMAMEISNVQLASIVLEFEWSSADMFVFLSWAIFMPVLTAVTVGTITKSMPTYFNLQNYKRFCDGW